VNGGMKETTMEENCCWVGGVLCFDGSKRAKVSPVSRATLVNLYQIASVP